MASYMNTDKTTGGSGGIYDDYGRLADRQNGTNFLHNADGGTAINVKQHGTQFLDANKTHYGEKRCRNGIPNLALFRKLRPKQIADQQRMPMQAAGYMP